MDYRDKSFYNLQHEKNIIIILVRYLVGIWEREKNLDADPDQNTLWDVCIAQEMGRAYELEHGVAAYISHHQAGQPTERVRLHT
jgi:hypothetical protein